MKIGELARRTACKVETIRYYEQQGLLPEPGRTNANYRDYGQVHLDRLQFIRNCRNLDLAHEEIKELLQFLDHPERDCGGVNEVLGQHLLHVETRIQELNHLHQQLSTLSDRCRARNSASECGILHGLSDGKIDARHSKSHV